MFPENTHHSISSRTDSAMGRANGGRTREKEGQLPANYLRLANDMDEIIETSSGG
ncbi:hypothetical protein DPMN_164315 [Dreissena polymorpha]|uniref:Uncharacterized protein n=1 Tax=Dreissena polymorpha TaxID=45954 RepID=A0A9D4EUX4_DREPO|nr:hypothetical protein DPMN_164315 [Dreissena polymorpha]